MFVRSFEGDHFLLKKKTIIIMRWTSKNNNKTIKQFLTQHVTPRKEKKNHNKLFVRYFNILPDLMSFICPWRFGLWSFSVSFGLALVFLFPLNLILHWNPLWAQLYTLSQKQCFAIQSSSFQCCFPWCFFLGLSSTPPTHTPCWRSPLFLSISWSVLLYLGGWYLHPLPSLLRPPLPDTI